MDDVDGHQIEGIGLKEDERMEVLTINYSEA
jgi:hypothetical protein